MDSQRSLFKKFFGNNNTAQNVGTNDNNGNRGFNPPKFQFDKKKLGSIMNRTAETTNEDTDIIKDNVIDDSELGDHMDDWMDTIATMDNSTVSTVNTMNTTKVTVIEAAPKETAVSIPKDSKDCSLFNGILQKNHQKYNLSNQLEYFNEEIEVFLRNCGEKRNKMELLVLSLDEKIGKHKKIFEYRIWYVSSVFCSWS